MNKKINAVNGYIVEDGLQVVECNGKKYGLLEDAVVYFDDMEAIAKAVMIGDKVEENYADVYYLKWKIDDDYKPVDLQDLSDACNWQEPDAVISTNDFVEINNVKRFVFEYAPKDTVIVDGKYALISSLEKVVSPYEDEIIDTALAVDMSDEIVDNRWAKTYRIYWFGNDDFENPSMIVDEQISVEISPFIFARRRKNVS